MSDLRATPNQPAASRLASTLAGAGLLLLGLLILGSALWNSAQRIQAQSGFACSAAYRVDETLPTGARWEMCWEHRNLEGIVLHDITFTPVGGPRRLVLASASLAQVHVPYDDNGARFHDISDFGFGGTYLDNLTPPECPNGTFLKFGSKNAICQQIESRGYAQKYYPASRALEGFQLSLFSASHSGDYNYITQWIFKDDGTIEPTVGAAGKLQRYGPDPQYGWVTQRTPTVRIPISHYHNYWFRLDFDIDGLANDLVEEIQFNPADSNRRRTISVAPIQVETGRSHDSSLQRSWRIRDTFSVNNAGNPISYHIEGLTSGHQFDGPAFEAFSHNDLYVTRARDCERFPSRNPKVGGCGGDVTEFVNGESVNSADLIVWYGITFHHLPREEEEVYMDVHWDSFTIVPRDWTGTNPLDSVVNGGATMTPTATRVPPTPTTTPTPTPVLSVVPATITLLEDELPQDIPITLNAPSASVEWSAVESSAWLTLTAITGTTPAGLDLRVAPSLAAADIYTAHVTFTRTDIPTRTVDLLVTVLRGLEEKNYMPGVGNVPASP